jgi:serine/threonine-protein kinase
VRDKSGVDATGGATVTSTPSSTARAPRFRAIEPGARLGRYEIQDELGAGGMATVYRARDTELRRDVAVKVLFPHLCKKREVVARFQREARAAAGLDHPHILRVYDVGGGDPDGSSPSDPPYIVLELVRGKSLRELIADRGPLLAEAVACAGAVLCEALAEAHRAGIIHRDIKPANVMIAEGGRLVLADFGVAHIEDEDSLVTRTGALLGTPAFMSPEQAQGTELDERSDVYSLGATLYQLATGSVPFSGSTAQVVSSIARGEMTPPLRRNPKIGPDLARIIERMMAVDRDQRPANAATAGGELRAAYESVGIDDAETELAELLADPDEYLSAREPRVVAATLELARAAAEERRLPRAMALADRVLAFEPDNTEAVQLVERLGRGERLAAWLKIAAVLVLVAGAGITAWVMWPGSGPEERAAFLADAGADAAVSFDAAIAVADETIDAAARVATAPVDAHAAATKRHPPTRIRKRRPDASVRVVTVPVDAAAPRPVAAPPDAAPAMASIELELNAWCDLSIDGRSMGRAKRGKRYRLRAGPHQLVCSQGRGLGHWERSIRLRPGEHRKVVGSVIAPVAVRVAVTRGDGVRIGGTYYGNGVRATLRPDRYRVDVYAAGKKLTGRWVTIPRGGGCTLRDTPRLGCYQ